MEKGKHICIIDDDKDFAESLEMILSATGYLVTVAHTAAEGIRCLKQQEINILLLDVKLPDCSGVALLAEIRAMKPDLPIAIMSGFSAEQFVTQYVLEQTCCFLRKPFDVCEVIRCIDQKS